MPFIIEKLWNKKIFFKGTSNEKTLYLSFDDGPHPDITRQVLEILSEYQAKATFFCIGSNMEKYPLAFQEIIKNGHRIGNHSMTHLDGWKTPLKTYLDDINECDKLIGSNLFRPPYGRIHPLSIGPLRRKYQIVLWSLLSRDFDINIQAEECTKQTLKNVKNGDVIVFHDSEKALPRLLHCLPALLKTYTDKGFEFRSLP
jgi:peptidoglycan/xylan/chitin deacetylase (PgdA/CDA1 family)